MSQMKSIIYAYVGPDNVIIAKGNKKQMLALVSKANKTKKGHYLGLTHTKQVGDKFK